MRSDVHTESDQGLCAANFPQVPAAADAKCQLAHPIDDSTLIGDATVQPRLAKRWQLESLYAATIVTVALSHLIPEAARRASTASANAIDHF